MSEGSGKMLTNVLKFRQHEAITKISDGGCASENTPLFAYRIYDFWIDWFRKNSSSRSNIIDKFVERRSLYFFAFQVANGVHEIEDYTTLL
jgi:hypothetical protein